LFCHVVIETPVSLTERQRQLLREFESTVQQDSARHNPRAKGWLDKVKAFLPLLAALTLAGCYNPRYPSETPGDRPRPNETGASGNASADRNVRYSPNTVSNVYRTGVGTVETVNRSPSPSAGLPSASSAAGGTNVRNDEVALRMDDGTRQI